MKTKVLYLLSLFLAGVLSAQEEGVVPPNQSTNNKLTNHQTRAVVVGISDYQDEGIPGKIPVIPKRKYIKQR